MLLTFNGFNRGVQELFRHTKHLWPIVDAFLIRQDVPDVAIDLIVRPLHDAVLLF